MSIVRDSFRVQISPKDSLGAAITDTTSTSITPTTPALFPVGSVFTVDNEMMLVAGLGSTTRTVVRGYNGTTAATHLNGAVTTASVIQNCPTEAESFYDFEMQAYPGGQTGFTGTVDFYLGFIKKKTITFNNELKIASWQSSNASDSEVDNFASNMFSVFEEENGVDGTGLLGKMLITNTAASGTLPMIMVLHFMRKIRP